MSFRFDGALSPYLEARGSTLFVHGKGVSVDITPSSYARFSIAWIAGQHETGAPRAFKFIPGAHRVTMQAGPTFVMTVTATGGVTHEPALDAFLDVPEPTVLVVRGTEVSVDARATTYALFSIAGVSGAHSPQQLHGFRLIPGKHHLRFLAGPFYDFTIDAAGHVDYPPALDGALDGRGTTTLVVHGITN
jgi:hypothetical protein